MKRLAILLTLAALPAAADPVTVVGIDTSQTDGVWRFSLTLEHADTGWDHYADAWEILDADDNRLGIRELAHPHVNEQPFTRSLSDVVIPEGTTTVYIRARENVDGWNSETTEFLLPN